MDHIAYMDSHCATAGVASRTNNPANVRPLHRLDPFAGQIAHARFGAYEHFANVEDGIYGAVSLYVRKYAGKQPENIVKTWANTKNKQYIASLSSCYE